MTVHPTAADLIAALGTMCNSTFYTRVNLGEGRSSKPLLTNRWPLAPAFQESE
jgi:hypothetical protein